MPVLVKASLYVGVDVGTQGTKALVYDSKKNAVVSRGARPYDIEKTKVPGRAEQHPKLWIEVIHLSILGAHISHPRTDVPDKGSHTMAGCRKGLGPLKRLWSRSTVSR